MRYRTICRGVLGVGCWVMGDGFILNMQHVTRNTAHKFRGIKY